MDILTVPNMREPLQIFPIQDEECWMDPIFKYLQTGELPSDSNKEMKLSLKTLRFTFYERKL